MHWKTARVPAVLDWYNEVVKWGKAESAELKREESRGLRKKPISMEWNVMLEDFIATEAQTSQTEQCTLINVDGTMYCWRVQDVVLLELFVGIIC